MICVYGILFSLAYFLLYTVHSNVHTCPSHAPRKDYGSKFSVGTMSFPGGYPAEINTLVDTFIFRYKLSHEVAAKLVKCSLGIQWQVISPRAPKVVHKPNGFVMGRIIRAMKSSLEAPPSQLCRSALVKSAEAVESTESPVPLVEESPSSPTHPSPWADWVGAPESDREKLYVHTSP